MIFGNYKKIVVTSDMFFTFFDSKPNTNTFAIIICFSAKDCGVFLVENIRVFVRKTSVKGNSPR